MKYLIQSKVFFAGFVIGIVLFIVLNLVSQSTTPYYVREHGFPFSFYEWRFGSETNKVGSLTVYDTVKVSRIVWSGIVANMFIASVSSFFIGLIFKFVWSKILVRYRNLS
jgi:hypothetical protein